MNPVRCYSTYPKVSWFDAVIFRGLDSVFSNELTIKEWYECYGWYSDILISWLQETRKKMIYHPPLLLDIEIKCIRISNENLMILSRDLPLLCHSLERNPCPFLYRAFDCLLTNCRHPEREMQEICIISNKCPLPDYSTMFQKKNTLTDSLIKLIAIMAENKDDKPIWEIILKEEVEK